MTTKRQGAASAARVEKTAQRRGDHAGETVFENPLLPHKKLKAMYADVVACRNLERRALALLKKRKTQGFAGREAALIAIAHNLLPQDRVSANGDAVMTRFLLGEPAEDVLKSLRDGKRVRGRHEGRVLPRVDGVAKRMKAAAAAAKAGKKKQVVVTYVGADEIGEDWLKALKAVGRRELPMVFVCEDAPGVKQRDRDRQWKALQKTARRREVPVIPVDGRDVVAMFRAAQESVARARMGLGPTVLWCERWTLTRSKQDAVSMFEAYLAQRRLLMPAKKRQVAAVASRKIRAA